VDFDRTGSIAQDALRLGFQTTCNAGIATLLKIDDIATEACQEFKERHIVKACEYVENFVQEKEKELHNKFVENMTWVPYHVLHEFTSWIPFRTNYIQRKFKDHVKSQQPREYKIVDLVVSDPMLDVVKGRWYTTISYKFYASSWEGIFKGEPEWFAAEKKEVHHDITTDAKVCTVKYIPYDAYAERYIPDEVVSLAAKAKIIGMTNILVAKPSVNIVMAANADPIIVGHIGEQMFLIAMFGQDPKDHMSFNI